MSIDPVLLLVEELTIKKCFFTTKNNTTGSNTRAPRKEMRASVRKIIKHFQKCPTEVGRISAIGAGTLTLLAAQCLPSDHAHSDCLEGIGHRLSAGNRLLPDLIKLRELLHDFSHEMHIELASEISALLKLSMNGASIPLLIFRSVEESTARTSRRKRCHYCGLEHSG